VGEKRKALMLEEYGSKVSRSSSFTNRSLIVALEEGRNKLRRLPLPEHSGISNGDLQPLNLMLFNPAALEPTFPNGDLHSDPKPFSNVLLLYTVQRCPTQNDEYKFKPRNLLFLHKWQDQFSHEKQSY
jgi:hypothetical protein